MPVERLAEYVLRWEKIVADEGSKVAFYAHASVGVLHIRPFLDPNDSADRDRMLRIAERVTDMVVELGGSISGEHGDGRSRSPWLRKMYGDRLVAAFGQVKDAFDPDRLLNPNIIVDPEPMTAHSRHTPGRSLMPVDTIFDYSVNGGFDEAVEACNGQGLCRKTLTGTMCPSYMVLMEEGHSTRGRANAIREMLLGNADGTWDSEQVAELLDLCLSCKGCKGECPSNVDLAKLKAELLYQRFKLTGHRPMKATVFGHIGVANRLGSFFAPLSNWVMKLAPARWALSLLLGTDTRRTMPPYVRENLVRWWKRRGGSGVGDDAGTNAQSASPRPGDQRRDQEGLRRQPEGHPGFHHGSGRLQRYAARFALQHRGRPVDQGSGWQPAEDRLLVRQRVGLFLPRRRPGEVHRRQGPLIPNCPAHASAPDSREGVRGVCFCICLRLWRTLQQLTPAWRGGQVLKRAPQGGAVSGAPLH